MEKNWLAPFNWTASPLTRRYENDPFSALQREMTRMFDDMARGFGALPAAAAGGFAGPRIDIKENNSEICILAELPGVEEKDLDVTLNGDLLTIRGEKRAEINEREGEHWHMMERSYGSFARTIRLPFVARPDEIQASFKDGVLRLTVPKSGAQGEHAHRIQIGGGESAPGRKEGAQKESKTPEPGRPEPLRRAAE
ncbi:MAG: heat-shock protein [Rhodospirillales bacterium]|nr:heat-shock protein [Rhodospirillales bacterium]